MIIRRYLFAVAACAALVAGPADAQSHEQEHGLGGEQEYVQEAWQARFDLLTAGAAASVMLHHLCSGAGSSAAAAEQAGIRLQRESIDTGQATAAQAYAVESYRLKLRAFEMSTQGLACSQLGRLMNIAVSQGFSIPAANR